MQSQRAIIESAHVGGLYYSDCSCDCTDCRFRLPQVNRLIHGGG
jgi:hypothetical protein